MQEFIKSKLETVYSDFCEAAENSEGLCALKKFSFAGGGSPDYADPLVRKYYMLKYFPAYLAEYYLMYSKLIRNKFLPEDDIDILSIGCGCGVDYWGFHFSAKKRLKDNFRSTSSYTGYDIIPWEYREDIDNVNVKFFNSDIGDVKNLHSGKFAYNLIVFPKSISDLPEEAFKKLLKAFEATKFKRYKIAILCSLMLDDDAQEYDWKRLNKIIEIMKEKHGYTCEDDLDTYYTGPDPKKGLRKAVPNFVYGLDIDSTISSTLNHCPNFIDNDESCKPNCSDINQQPILTQKYVNYAIRRLTKG